MAENPLISLGQLTMPINTLIERSSDAVGGLFRPWQIRRVARAEAEAEIIRAEQEIEVTELHKRAFWRFLQEEGAKQTNMESVLVKAIPSVDQQNARPEDISDDWLTNFFDKCRITSDEDVQELWARILAGEANSPGSFSRRTVNLMADLDKDDAELFESLCTFIWMLHGNKQPLIFDTRHEIYNLHGINFISTGHLESLGLVRFNSLTGFKIDPAPSQLRVSYHDKRKLLTLPNNQGYEFSIGMVMFTQPGIELSQVSKPNPSDEYFNYVCEIWRKEGIIIRE